MQACSSGAWRHAVISVAWHEHTSDAALVLDAAGSDVVIIETVGVGQDEVDIVSAADISIVLLVPGAGDDLQAIKAGVMEIGDIFVVNKADREGADRVVQAVASNLSLKTYDASEWKPPILKTEATTGAGVDVAVEGESAGSENGRASIGSRAGGNGTRRASRCACRSRSCAMSTARFRQRTSIAIVEAVTTGPAIHTQSLKRS